MSMRLTVLLLLACAACDSHSAQSVDPAQGNGPKGPEVQHNGPPEPTTPIAGGPSEPPTPGTANAGGDGSSAPGAASGTPSGTPAGPGDLDAGSPEPVDAGRTDGGATTDTSACPGVPASAFEPQPELKNDFDRSHEGLRALRAEAADSLARFEALKLSEGDDYIFTQRVSSFVGSSCETELEVRGGRVVRRRQTSTGADGTPGESWVEEGSALGSHQGCHPLQTLDDLYAICLDDVLCRDPADHYLNLKTFDDGLLSLCSYIPRNCADDCSVGPALSAFMWL